MLANDADDGDDADDADDADVCTLQKQLARRSTMTPTSNMTLT